MQVTLLDVMGDDGAVVDAARVSMDKSANNFTAKQNEKLIRYLADHNHWSPFSHCVAKFRIKAPIFVARQLVKHQVGLSWNEVSRRYVNSPPDVFMPEAWRKRADNVKQGSSDEAHLDTLYFRRKAFLLFQDAIITYEEMIADGVAPELARIVLPQATYTEWIWTGSLYAWARVYNLRIDAHAQRETQEIAKLIGEAIEPLFPVSWSVLTGTAND